MLTAPARSGDPSYNGRNVEDPSVVNKDDDEAGFQITAVPPLTTSESGATHSFSVVLVSQPTAPVTLEMSSNDPGEGTVQPTEVTFTQANWNVSQMVTVTGIDDQEVDGDAEYRITVVARSAGKARIASAEA